MRAISSGALGALALLLHLGLAPDERQPKQPAEPGAPSASTVDQVVRDMCGKRIAFLGEAPMHGFGKTLEFKVELARRLVTECHYNAFFVESGAYDFVNIQRKRKAGQAVTQPMIAAAIGGLWAVREVEPLIPFLWEKAQSGALVLGGLDDQLGRGSYALQQMPADLVEYLEGEDKARCLAVFQRHTLWQYTEAAPYGPKDKALILDCLDKIEPRLSPPRDRATHENDAVMIANLRRCFARDFPKEGPPGTDRNAQGINDRDRSMSMNFRWWMSRLPARSKVIVWTATVHAAKSLKGVPKLEKMVSLGSYVQSEFKNDAFVLGISAYSGSYALGRQPVRQLPAAPADSIEGLAFAKGDSDTRYFNASQLRKFGAIPARPLSPDFRTASWGDVLDGLLVLREEHPPQLIAQ